MNKFIRTFLSFTLLLVLSACFPTPTQAVIPGPLKLEVRTQNGATTFSRVDEPVNYLYVVHNSTGSPLQGLVTITDGTRQVVCPLLNTVGNLNATLDVEEEIVCPYEYRITQSDLNTGSVTNLATASVGGVTSNQTGITLTRAASNVLTLAKTANPTAYSAVGQTINYSYTITNIGTTPLGPTQFVINDNKQGAQFNCGPADTTLAANQPITCAAPTSYVITQADMSAPNVTNTATASGANQTSAPVTATVVNSTLVTPTATPILTPLPPSGSTCPTSQQQKVPGTTCLHQVAKGEWLIQIGRCYGVSLNDLISANPSQIKDPSVILPSMLLTVPRIGSAGTIHGSPCITFVTVQSGDTVASLALRYKAREDVLRLANPGGLVVGQQARIPLNSADGGGVTVPPGATATPTMGTTPVQRITIPAGQTSAPVAGVVNPLQSVSYVIAATQGQTLSVSLTGIGNTEATLGVTGPTGLALKTPDGNFTWNTTVTTGGDHTITITSLIGGSSRTYTLVVGLSSPVPPATATPTIPAPAPTATPTNTPITAIP